MYNNDLYSVLKKVAVNAVNSSKPCDWCYGYVISVSPFSVRISDRFEIDKDFIEFGSRKIENFEIGDKLILLRKAGGQLFLCLDVINGGG